jgi:hypothetical protein
MDIISYGEASKVTQQMKRTSALLGEGVQGSSASAKERIDLLQNGVEAVNSQANQMIVSDAINIMKAHAKVNAIAKTTKYKMHNMVFDDLLDLTGIDTSKSTGYSHNATLGLVSGLSNAVIQSKSETTEGTVVKVILAAEVEGSAQFSVSRDNGTTFESIEPDTLFYFADRTMPAGNQLCFKAELTYGSKLLNYALTWV